ncbi:hypothetical protein HRI_001387800 [Hibiscus trionum]|uniref:Uncharacterized protein n=1 Tax=Hibiscus trionum TaxID=183268 RepID=A0A9W7HJU8_HIBTR|nr:hypothetical protein HRI_001387800 [Hibiscus trionum]
MSTPRIDPLVQLETTCKILLVELQELWSIPHQRYLNSFNFVPLGKIITSSNMPLPWFYSKDLNTNTDRVEMLLELERECVEVYKRRVDQANLSKAYLRQTIADYEAELAAICSTMGERQVIKERIMNPARQKKAVRIIPRPTTCPFRPIIHGRKNRSLEDLHANVQVQQ